jgi:GNAT superfamily N-acetyltransferase
MTIQQARSEADWGRASEILLRVVERLNQIGKPLWTENQVSVAGLQRSYQLEELHFLTSDSCCVGVVFLQESDTLFWPEVIDRDSLYLHKLAIDTPFSGKVNGASAIEAILREADKRALSWLRLDCDDRPELHRFYQACGFELVDIKQIESFQVARYQRLTNAGKQRQNTTR